MKISTDTNVSCSFNVEKFNKDGIIFTTGPFFNTILSSGVQLMYTTSVRDLTTFINIGSDNTVPANDQTGLIARLFSTDNVISSVASFNSDPKHNLKVTKVFRFDIGTCTGTFKEVGLSKTSNTDYFNRQLLKNSGGTPIEIAVGDDEGLLLTVELKIFLDPGISYIGEVNHLDLKEATGGSFTLKVGTKESAVINYEDFSTSPDKVDAAVKELVDPDLVVSVTGTLATGFNITFLPLAGQTGISIGTNSLTGNTEAPTLTVTTSNPVFPITFNVNDVDAGTTTVMKLNRSIPLNVSESVWGLNEITNPLYIASIQEWTYEINGKTPSSIERTPPTLGNPEVTDTCTWLPGRISTDASFNFHTIKAKIGGKDIYEYRLVDDITILNTEEIKFVFKRGWGRWSDINV